MSGWDVFRGALVAGTGSCFGADIAVTLWHQGIRRQLGHHFLQWAYALSIIAVVIGGAAVGYQQMIFHSPPLLILTVAFSALGFGTTRRLLRAFRLLDTMPHG